MLLRDTSPPNIRELEVLKDLGAIHIPKLSRMHFCPILRVDKDILHTKWRGKLFQTLTHLDTLFQTTLPKSPFLMVKQVAAA